jgi:hypothetical protein
MRGSVGILNCARDKNVVVGRRRKVRAQVVYIAESLVEQEGGARSADNMKDLAMSF